MKDQERAVDIPDINSRLVYTSPNQRIIYCHNDSLNKIREDERLSKETHNRYDCVIHEIESAAMRDLSGNEFKIYCYFRKNQDGYKFALSPVDACSYTGLNEKAYRSAVNALIQKGYLLRRDKPRNVFDFYIVPKRKDDVPITAVSSTPEGSIIPPITAVSSTPEGGFHPSLRAGEIIQVNTMNNTVDNTIYSTVDNRNTIGGEGINEANRLANSFCIFEEDDDELPF